MVHLRCAVFVSGLALCSAFALAQATATITHNGNLRPTPSIAQAPIRLLTPPEVVTLVNSTPVNGYYHVHTTHGEDGWVYRSSVTLGSAAPTPQVTSCGPGTEIVPHLTCPAVGTHGQNVAYAANSDAGLRNMAKRHVPDPSCTPKTFSLDDARSLQNYITNTYADARTTKTQFAPTRTLANIPTFDGSLGEGDSVRLSAYLIVAKDEGAESVNCGGADGTDIHISLGPKGAGTNEYAGIVAEMIPQVARPVGWDATTLNRLVGKQVLVIGGLTYDNEHFVNDNPASPKSGQPQRFSLKFCPSLLTGRNEKRCAWFPVLLPIWLRRPGFQNLLPIERRNR